jgi:hypothetical protein
MTGIVPRGERLADPPPHKSIIVLTVTPELA